MHTYTHITLSPHYVNPTHTITKLSRAHWQITSPALPQPLDFPSYSAARAYAATQTFTAPIAEVAKVEPVATVEPEQPKFDEPPVTTEQHMRALIAVAETLPDPLGVIALAVQNLDGVALCGHLVESETEAGSVAVDNIRAHITGLGSTLDRIAEAYGVDTKGVQLTGGRRLGVVLDDLKDRPGVVRWVAQSMIIEEDSWVGRLALECDLMRGCNGGWMKDGMDERAAREAQEGKSVGRMDSPPADDAGQWRMVWGLCSGEWGERAREDVGELLRGGAHGVGDEVGGMVRGDASALLLPEPEQRILLSDGRALIANWTEDVRPDGGIWGSAAVWVEDDSELSLVANWAPHSGIGWRSPSVIGVDLVALDRLLEVINEEGLAIAR